LLVAGHSTMDSPEGPPKHEP